MCGRFFILANPPELADLFQLASVPDVTPRYNVAPTQAVPAVRLADGGRELVCLRWGLVAPWAKDTKIAPINARAETAAEKPTFRHAVKKRRCLIPGSGFYEWLRHGKAKQPFAFRLADDKPFAFAGLWERWHGPDGELESCCILTTEANDLVRPVHDRMPVILDPRHYEEWLDPAKQDSDALAPMLRPFAADRMRAYPANPWVNDARHEEARCLEPDMGTPTL